MNEKDVFESGGKILNRINKAVETGNFSNISKDIKSFISETAANSNIGSEIRKSVESGIKTVLTWKNGTRTPFFSVKINKHKGIGKIILGSLIDFIAILNILGSKGIRDCIVEIIFLLIGTLLIIMGKGNRKIIKNYFKFGKIIGDRSYITVEELSDKAGKAPKYIINQINRMKNLDYLPYATMDKAETTLMLTDEIYKEYLKSRVYCENRQKDIDSKNESSENQTIKGIKYYTIDENLPEEVQNILKEGNTYLNKIRYFNDLIPDTETMSDKLYTLEATALSIFKKLKEAPDIAGDLRKFMSYYLPTTEKLLQSYVKLRKESMTVENITKSQKEIEEATDVINEAFVKLLNQLFEDTSWDISSDISVMKTMMKQDALL